MPRHILLTLALFALAFTLLACTREKEEEGPDIPKETIDTCEIPDPGKAGDFVPIKAVHLEDADMYGHPEDFLNLCKESEQAPLVFGNATRNTYRVVFELDSIYPLGAAEITNYLHDETDWRLKDVSIETSLDGRTYTRLHDGHTLEGGKESLTIGQNARFLRLVFSAERGRGNHGGDYFALSDFRLRLEEGFIISESPYHTDPFFRMSGWTGADGIFSYDLTHGMSHIEKAGDDILFIFSDTFIGEVYEHNKLRHGETIVNNTLAYYDAKKPFADGLTFHWAEDEQGPGSFYTPEAYYGYHPANIMNGDGLDFSHTPTALLSDRGKSHMWKSADTTADRLLFDFYDVYQPKELHLWNFNEDPEFGIKDFSLYYGNDADNLTYHGSYTLERAPGGGPAPRQSISGDDHLALDFSARYVAIEIHDNHEDTPTRYGLGKAMFLDEEGRLLHAAVEAANHDESTDALEESSRLWLQDGVVIGDYYYNFPILVKDFEGSFKVHKVGLSRTPIVDGELDVENIVYLDSPLQVRTEDGGEIFFGAGVMNLATHPDIEDPYIYVYGYKDLDGRHLTVARVRPEKIEDFNAWEFFDGEEFRPDIRQSAKGIRGVSAELSVTHIPEGRYAEKYMLVSMQDTISGRIVYATADSPEGPFSDFTLIYRVPEPYQFDNVFTYNAKMHPVLSTADTFVISYNVNGTSSMALKNARVYYPRFLTMQEAGP